MESRRSKERCLNVKMRFPGSPKAEFGFGIDPTHPNVQTPLTSSDETALMRRLLT
jgi:hypothetical protein